MSTPRPTEADVGALASHVLDALHAAHHRPGNITMLDLAQSVAEVLASDWLAARDAEHQREVEALRAERDDARQMYADLHAEWGREIDHCDAAQARTEAAERDRDEARRELADLRAKVAALAAKWKHPGLLDDPDENAHDDLRALLPTEDDQ